MSDLTSTHRDELHRMADRLYEMSRLVPLDVKNSPDEDFDFVSHFLNAAENIEKAARKITHEPKYQMFFA